MFFWLFYHLIFGSVYYHMLLDSNWNGVGESDGKLRIKRSKMHCRLISDTPTGTGAHQNHSQIPDGSWLLRPAFSTGDRILRLRKMNCVPQPSGPPRGPWRQ